MTLHRDLLVCSLTLTSRVISGSKNVRDVFGRFWTYYGFAKPVKAESQSGGTDDSRLNAAVFTDFSKS
jgi:hypothetical protein